jgi:hypothetical protein
MMRLSPVCRNDIAEFSTSRNFLDALRRLAACSAGRRNCMERARTADETDREIAFHALGFLVKVEGSWTESALAQFRHFLHLRRLSPSDDELRVVLERPEKPIATGQTIYICVRHNPTAIKPASTLLSERSRYPVPSSPMLTPMAASCVNIGSNAANGTCNLPMIRPVIAPLEACAQNSTADSRWFRRATGSRRRLRLRH